ncbi:MAG: hypothetical protein KIT89_04195 [Microcella sp.]|uniref:hypothetical protein n=1 Tax=Microcella sp. TaxID=1913979 RepID=UPI0024CC70A2|nr:hypothetical protein [Microcella sp.]UYN84399.1 MAG: hypothetical protein KIT89_04195 [Microcella sp.]
MIIDTDHARLDETKVRNQPALTSTAGTTWVVMAAVSAVLLGAMLLMIDGLRPVGFSAVVIMGVLLVSMVLVRAWVAAGRVRLTALAALYSTMIVVALLATLVLAGGASR